MAPRPEVRFTRPARIVGYIGLAPCSAREYRAMLAIPIATALAVTRKNSTPTRAHDRAVPEVQDLSRLRRSSRTIAALAVSIREIVAVVFVATTRRNRSASRTMAIHDPGGRIASRARASSREVEVDDDVGRGMKRADEVATFGRIHRALAADRRVRLRGAVVGTRTMRATGEKMRRRPAVTRRAATDPTTTLCPASDASARESTSPSVDHVTDSPPETSSRRQGEGRKSVDEATTKTFGHAEIDDRECGTRSAIDATAP